MVRRGSIFWFVVVTSFNLALSLNVEEEFHNGTLLTKSFPVVDKDSSCQFSLNTSVETNYNESDAILQVTVNSPPSSCNFSWLELKLLSNRCGSRKFKVHTPKHKVFLYAENTTKTEKVKICDIDIALRRPADRVELENATTFKIRHVYSGSYCLRISLFDKGKTEAKTFNQDLEFTTNKTVLFPTKWKPQIEFLGPTRWIIPFRFKLVKPEYNFEHFLINLYKVRSSCPNSEKDWKKLTKLPNSGACMYLTLKDITKANDASFSNLRSGSYCMVVTPVDERCHPEATYWQESAGLSCTRYLPHTIKVGRRSAVRRIFEKIFGI